MDSNHLVEVLLGLTALAFFYSLLLRARKARELPKRTEAPLPEGAWPVIGHLPLLRGKENLAFILGSLADKYGPAFTLQLGAHRTLVISSNELAKECLGTNDKVFASRPSSAFSEHMGYDYAMIGLARYGPYWREVRKIATLELLSNSRLETLKHVRVNEVENHMKGLYELWVNNHELPVKVEMKQWLGELTCNIVVKIVAGKRCYVSGGDSNVEGIQRFREAMSQFFVHMGALVPSDMFPFLKGMDLGGYEKAMKRTAGDMDSVLVSWLEEHRQRRRLTEKSNGGDLDFMDVMISFLEDAQLEAYDPDKIIKATSLNLIMGGTDTTAITLTWILALLLNNPHVLRKAQEELDVHVGKDRAVNDSDMKNLPYVQAIVKESLRLYPAGPLLGQHEAREDCEIGGFHVPSGTRLLVNVLKIQRDPHVWPEPLRFMPERFMTSHAEVDVRGKHFELLPFGSGRRSCPGASFALQALHFVVARLIQGFELRAPSDEPVDMSVGVGFTMNKLKPLDVICTPRLSPELYKWTANRLPTTHSLVFNTYSLISHSHCQRL